MDLYLTWHPITPISSYCVKGKIWKYVFLTISICWILVILSLMGFGSLKRTREWREPLHKCLDRTVFRHCCFHPDCFLAALSGSPMVSCPPCSCVVFPPAPSLPTSPLCFLPVQSCAPSTPLLHQLTAEPLLLPLSLIPKFTADSSALCLSWYQLRRLSDEVTSGQSCHWIISCLSS